jgi:hypothetical protein
MDDLLSVRRREGFIFSGWLRCICAAGELDDRHVGTVCVPNGPCLVPRRAWGDQCP